MSAVFLKLKYMLNLISLPTALHSLGVRNASPRRLRPAWSMFWREDVNLAGARSLIPHLFRNTFAGSLNEGRKLPQPDERHSYCGSGYAHTGIHGAAVIPDGRCYTTDMWLVLLEVASVSVPPDFL